MRILPGADRIIHMRDVRLYSFNYIGRVRGFINNLNEAITPMVSSNFSPLCCMSFYDLRILITPFPLVS
jgi:hypothetical protein